jgi:coenzyme F420 hydrogenase subunit beta
MPPEKPQWKELYSEVVATGLCTGCSACIVACPHDVLKYNDKNSVFQPYHVDEDGGLYDCTHGQRGCTLCTRACPRFRNWENDAENYLFGRTREDNEVFGICREILLTRANDSEIQKVCQDGGFVSAALIFALENNIIDAALVSDISDSDITKAYPKVAHTREEVLKTAGSRYTYSANPLAYFDAINSGYERLALVGMSCQASIPAILSARKAGKVARRFELSIGLLCSKTFNEEIFDDFFFKQYGIKKQEILKINIKGKFEIWLKDGSYKELPLKEGHVYTRNGCKLCTDFAAQHADISVGGIGKFNDYTLTIIRTQRGQELLDAMIRAGTIETKSIDEDPDVINLLEKLSRVSRKRLKVSSN